MAQISAGPWPVRLRLARARDYSHAARRRIDPTWGQLVDWAMADLKVRHLDDGVADALKARARRKGISLEEEVRSTLAASVDARRLAFLRRARAIRKAIGGKAGAPALESTRLIRRERDERG